MAPGYRTQGVPEAVLTFPFMMELPKTWRAGVEASSTGEGFHLFTCL